MTFRVLVTDDLSVEAFGLLEAHPEFDFDVAKGLSPSGLVERIPGYDGLIVRSSLRASGDVIAAGDRLQVIGRAGVGVDNVDLQAAMERGVIVMNTPGANTVATAEHTMALLLALSRHVPQSVTSLRSGQWERSRFKGIELRSKTIGMVGLGRIGRRIARRCRGFGMDVITYDPYLTNERARSMKVERVSLDELLEPSDFITLHAALTPDSGVPHAWTPHGRLPEHHLLSCRMERWQTHDRHGSRPRRRNQSRGCDQSSSGHPANAVGGAPGTLRGTTTTHREDLSTGYSVLATQYRQIL